MIDFKEKIIDGLEIATKLTSLISKQCDALAKRNVIPGLAVILVGNDPVSTIYVNRKKETAKAVGINSHIVKLDDNIQENNLINKIHHLNNDPKINGILIQLPLPKHLNTSKIINSIDPAKDVDGLTNINVGKLAYKEKDALIPCTPQGCMILIKSVIKNASGKNAVVVGRSSIVGRPMATLLQNNNCTTTTVHSYTANPQEHTKKADILIAAVGKKHLITTDWIKDGAVIIDVGINRYRNQEGKIKLAGDVDFNSVIEKVSHITPVPGGVGPMTIACLLKNTIQATCAQRHITFSG